MLSQVVDKIDTSPYDARAVYVDLADQLLREIPGPHLKVMKTWPGWDIKKSPPVPGGNYPNTKWKPLPGSLSTNAAKPPSPHGPTISMSPRPLDQSIGGLSEGNLHTVPKLNGQKTLKATSKGDSTIRATASGGMLEPETAGNGFAVPLETIESSQHWAYDAETPFGAPVVGLAQIPAAAQTEDIVSIVSDESSPDLNDMFARIKGIRPEAPAISQGFGGSIGTPGGIAKHLAAMGGKVLFR